MQTIYCISGLGADEGAFQYLDLSFVKPVFLGWIKPLKNETLHAYAMRMKEKYIHEEKPLIFGLSLGGMIAVEIAKSIPSSKTIIISSAKTKNEIPFYLKTFRYIPLYKTLPDWSIRQHSVMREFFLGVKKEEAKNYVKKVAQNADADFYRWAVEAILNWKNETVPSNVVHIHGSNDKLLPYKFISADITVNNGGHLMIIENADKVSKLIKNIILN
jgi:pimeloyl-ACP methyl ester carboxylesterase